MRYTRDLYVGRAAATAMGVVNTVVLLVGAALQSLIGFLLDRQWTGLEQPGARIYTEAAYRHAFLVLAAASALALLSAFFAASQPEGPLIHYQGA